LNRMTSSNILHNLGFKRFFLWMNTVDRLSPAHSKRPLSRETENVMLVGMVRTPFSARKERKLGYVGGLQTICPGRQGQLKYEFPRGVFVRVTHESAVA